MVASHFGGRARARRARVVRLASLALAAALVGLSGCGLITPYRFELQQGNFVSSEMVEQLRAAQASRPEGVTRDQVRLILGSPMIRPLFRQDQWEYVFYNRKSSGEIVERKLTVFFKDDRMQRWEGDLMPSERPAPEPVAAAPQS
ncbi:outer membrane protein assembly factor BamE [Derxia lacustris]|uniref:outer membrane protein assembly factor BamE n=1 Tax=Derxia lacustris TaxID=764842 RepID=UPI000A17169E|nr:outer membrane protein assembly factor BamE [Derxia lacustris]